MGVRRHQEKKVIRLAECVSVLRLPPHAEACPGDNMAAFCVETDERRLVMAAEKEECVDWVEKVCEIAFQVNKQDHWLCMVMPVMMSHSVARS